jgi:two-component system chemotaxis sensor kinase CheA
MTDIPEMDTAQLLDLLGTTASRLESDDLPGLAKMHGWALALAQADGPVQAQATTLSAQLEALILGAVDDAETALAEVRAAVAELTGECDDSDPTPTDESSAEPNAIAQPPQSADTESAGPPPHSPAGRICAALRKVGPTDLPELAELHSQCQALAEKTGAEGQSALHDQCNQVAAALENIILGTVDDAAGVLGALADELAAAAGDSANTTPPAEAVDALTSTDVAGQLEGMFDEPESAAPAPEAATDASAGVPDIGEPVSAAPAAPSPTADAGEAPPDYVPEPLLVESKEIEFVAAFIEEAHEHLENIEAALLEVEQAPDDAEKINELFRPFHTIKGMAGFLNLRDVNCLTHEVETLLDQGRRGERVMSAGIIDTVFAVIDILKNQIAQIASYVSAPNDQPIPQPPVADMINRLRGIVAGRIDPDAGAPAGRAPAASQAAEAKDTEGTSAPADTPASNTAVKANVVEQSVRIDTDKLDALVDMVGELVIAQTLITSSPVILNDPNLSKNAGQVSKIVRDVQEAAMAMRMVPIKSTFQKMARLVRDLSRKAGKNVELAISGEDTELDKNVIQQIGDPLVHMVRNAVDHGIETVEERVAAGKTPTGHVRLNAFHHSGNIVIEIRDDGKGLDPEKLKAKAIEKGIIEPDDELTDEQAYHLIFAAGFSTAAQITDISGRGVGMDVVRRNIEQLRGRVEISSEKGQGSVFSIQLPLTLAIIDGMLVRIAADRYIIPTPMIEQALRPRPEQVTTVQNRGEVLNVRGRLVPLIQVGQLFKYGPRINPTDAMVVMAHTDSGDIGLVVDELIGQQQVVIKALGERFQGLRWLSGAAILGDGKVGLILDPSGVRSAHESWGGSTIRPVSALVNTTRDQQDPNATETDPQAETAAVAAGPADEFASMDDWDGAQPEA